MFSSTVYCFLLENGANPAARNKHGHTAIEIARDKNFPDIVKILSENVSVQSEGYKVRIAVFDFESRSKELSKDEITTLSDYIRSAFINNGNFTVISREEIGRAAEEYKLQSSGLTEESNAIRFGKILNFKKTVLGTIGKFGKNYIINIKILDLETGKYISAESVEARTKEDLLKVIGEKVTALAGKVYAGEGAGD